MKPVTWLGTSKSDLRAFPDLARQRLGFELSNVQDGRVPGDYKPFVSVGAGVYEICVQAFGQWRLMYVAKFDEAIYVLHVFGKKTAQTGDSDVQIARQRYKQLIQKRKGL